MNDQISGLALVANRTQVKPEYTCLTSTTEYYQNTKSLHVIPGIILMIPNYSRNYCKHQGKANANSALLTSRLLQ